jgi:hypothetical protein
MAALTVDGTHEERVRRMRYGNDLLVKAGAHDKPPASPAAAFGGTGVILSVNMTRLG